MTVSSNIRSSSSSGPAPGGALSGRFGAVNVGRAIVSSDNGAVVPDVCTQKYVIGSLSGSELPEPSESIPEATNVTVEY